MNDIAHHQRCTHHINTKTASIQAAARQWKDSLRTSCLKRAKAARRELLLRKRRCFYGDVNKDMQINKAYKANGQVILVARSLVDQEMETSMLYFDDCHLQRKQFSEEFVEGKSRLISWGDDSFFSKLESCKEEQKNGYKMSAVDYEDLLNEVAQELEREDELCEEELWEMERLEAMKRERSLHKDKYEDW